MSKEGSWEAEKLGTWEVGELVFAEGVVFLWWLGKEGNQEDRLAFYIDFNEPEKTVPVFKISIIIPFI